MPSKYNCSQGHHEKPVNGVCPRCLEIAEMEYDPVPGEAHLQAEEVGKGSDFYPEKEEQG